MDNYVHTAKKEARKSPMGHQHGCVAVDRKTGEILSVGHNYYFLPDFTGHQRERCDHSRYDDFSRYDNTEGKDRCQKWNKRHFEETIHLREISCPKGAKTIVINTCRNERPGKNPKNKKEKRLPSCCKTQ